MRTALAVALGALGGLAVGGGVAYAATRPAAGSAGGAALPAAATSEALPAGAPEGLVSSGPTVNGWSQVVSVSPDKDGLIYYGFLGDVFSFVLPDGAHWSASTKATSIGPETGSDPFVMTMMQASNIQLTWTDAHNTDHVTTLSIQIGGSFEATTTIAKYDYVILSMSAATLVALNQFLTAWSTSSTATPEQHQEVFALQSAIAQMPTGTGMAGLIGIIFTVGPWALKFAADVHAFVAFVPGQSMPDWWPSDDKDKTTGFHVLYRYLGPGVKVSDLPFLLNAWKRVA